MGTVSGVTIAIAFLVVVLVIAWIVLPIAVIGTKPLLREIRDELRRLNKNIEGRRG